MLPLLTSKGPCCSLEKGRPAVRRFVPGCLLPSTHLETVALTHANNIKATQHPLL